MSKKFRFYAKLVFLLFCWTIFLYFSFSFYSLDFDFTKWSEDTRVYALFFWVMWIWIGFGAYFEKLKD